MSLICNTIKKNKVTRAKNQNLDQRYLKQKMVKTKQKDLHTMIQCSGMSLFYSAYLYHAVVKECKAIQLFSSRVDSDSVKSSGILMDKYANSDPSSCQRSTSWGFYINWIRPFHPTAIWSSPLKSFKRDLVVKFWKWIIFSDDQISNWNMWSRTASFWQATKTEFRSEKLDWFQEWNSRPNPLVIFGISSICRARFLLTSRSFFLLMVSQFWRLIKNIRLILRCWGNSSILCQQNSDAL